MPECQDLDATDFCVDLVVEVVASAAHKKATNTLFFGVASACSDPWLSRDEFEGPLDVLDEAKRACRTIGTPPCGRSPDL